MNQTKLIQEELPALWWCSANIHKDTTINHPRPVTKAGAMLPPDLHRTQGKLYWTRGAAEALLLAWALREDGKRAEVYWEVGERGLVVFAGSDMGTDCCLLRR